MIDSARRAQDKKKSRRILLFHAEPQPILSKVSDYGMKRSLK